MATAPPLPKIHREHLPGYSNYRPPLLHFGWHFEPNALLKWAAANGIDTTMRYYTSAGPTGEEPNSLFAVVRPKVLAILAEKAGTPGLRPIFKLGIRRGGQHLIVISSNYRFLEDKKSITRGRVDVFDRYLKEHGIVVDSPAWHLDCEDYKWSQIR